MIMEENWVPYALVNNIQIEVILFWHINEYNIQDVLLILLTPTQAIIELITVVFKHLWRNNPHLYRYSIFEVYYVCKFSLIYFDLVFEMWIPPNEWWWVFLDHSIHITT